MGACNPFEEPGIDCDTADDGEGAQTYVEMAPGDIAFLDGFHVDVKVAGRGEKVYTVVFPVVDDDAQVFHFGDVGLEQGDVYAFSDGALWVGFAGLQASYFFRK